VLHNLNVYIPGIGSRAFIAGLKELAIATNSAGANPSSDGYIIWSPAFAQHDNMLFLSAGV
jgi:hypothetical protein